MILKQSPPDSHSTVLWEENYRHSSKIQTGCGPNLPAQPTWIVQELQSDGLKPFFDKGLIFLR